ncbi:MAG TPA: TrbC/VirB2 family protein [Candidatus Saccharimonadales bacterium]|nr:TrbC/VirB2 family protein [Candidatus Saccharimonadales bacterium]
MKRLLTKASYITALTLLTVPAAFAGVSDGANEVQPTGTPTSLPTAAKNISDTLIYIVGAVAVIMLIIGGLRYVASQGDAAGVKAAKDTILYGIVGVVVAILAYAIVAFVTGSI